MEVLDLSDEAAGIDIDGYLVPRLYVAAIIIDKTAYKLSSESFKELLAKL